MINQNRQGGFVLRMVPVLLWLISGTCFWEGLNAQHRPNTQQIKPALEHLSQQAGLSDNFITSVLKGPHGFVWIATRNGLNRFDGREFRIYRKDSQNPFSLGDNHLKCLLKDAEGRLWIGTNAGGLFTYNAVKDHFEKQPLSEDSSTTHPVTGINALAEDPQRNLWVGTSGSGLIRYDRKQGTHVVYKHNTLNKNSLADDMIRVIHVDKDGHIWIGTDSGLDLYNPDQDTFSHVQFLKSLSDNFRLGVQDIYSDQNGMLWLATITGLVRFNPRDGSARLWRPVKNFKENHEYNRITAIERASDGTLWIGTFSRGLFLFDMETFRPVPLDQITRQSLAENGFISSIYKDTSGIVWIATGKGLYKKIPHPSVFRNWTHAIGAGKFTSDVVWPLLEDHNGVIWIGTIAGLNRFDPHTGVVTQYKKEDGLSQNAILALCEDSRGNLWIGTFNGGLSRLEHSNQQFTNWYFDANHPESLPHNLVSVLYEDRMGELWIGTAKGPARFDRKQNRPVRLIFNASGASLNDQYIQGILEDHLGNLWFTTSKSGLFMWNRRENVVKQWTYDPLNPHSISANDLTDIVELPDRRQAGHYLIWVGTESGGINRYDPQTDQFRAFTDKNGLLSNSINSLLADDDGQLWMGTDRGLSRLNTRDETIRTFDERDGLDNAHFNPWAKMKSRSGALYFGSSAGIIAFNPHDLAKMESRQSYPLVFTGLDVLNRPVESGTPLLPQSISTTDEIHLNYRDYIFTVRFALLDFTKPDQVLYVYKMEGLFNEWLPIGNQNKVDFTGLSPGSYTLHVKATNRTGKTFEHEARLRIFISPPYWETWWFRSALALLTGMFFFILYRMRLRRILEIQHTRDRIARDLHDEIGSNLSSLSLIGEVMGTRPGLDKEVREAFGDVHQAARHSVDALRDIVWFVNPMSDSLRDLVARMQATAQTMLSGTVYDFDARITDSVRKILPVVKRNIFLMYKEILNNILKHARAEKVRINVLTEGKHLILTVTDDGVGFNPESVQPGNGLSNLRERACQMKGELDIRSAKGKGTRIRLSVKIT
ncbi:MAG: hypothetical protein D6677_03220 [Calditrichaeota bacterium]|nr:MAG: hypothetical protein D6677_03220 [Calditrichota bacterium]